MIILFEGIWYENLESSSYILLMSTYRLCQSVMVLPQAVLVSEIICLAPTTQDILLTTGWTSHSSSLQLLSLSTAVNEAIVSPEIQTAFKIACFLPQIFWLLIIIAPNTKLTYQIMSPLSSIVGMSLVHLFIVITSLSLQDATAPISDFAKVFDLSNDNPISAMSHMFTFPNFVSEEWSHVLTWDLFVGRWIWLDGIKRGIFTPHSLLLTNLIGPPGLLLHLITCIVMGTGLPDDSKNSTIDNIQSVDTKQDNIISNKRKRADDIIKEYFINAYSSESSVTALISILADNIVWEDTSLKTPVEGLTRAADMLLDRVRRMRKGSRVIIERIAEGSDASGFMWYYECDGVEGRGLRGTTFIGINDSGCIDYVREVAEPLYKPGSAIIPLLKAVTEKGLKNQPINNNTCTTPFVRRVPTSASDLVKYLWTEAQGQDSSEFLQLVADDIVYEDFNYPKPFYGKKEVADFLTEFDFPGISFVPQRVSDGDQSCCFTWKVLLAGVPEDQAVKGISFYALNDDKKLSYLRDIPEPAIKPPPLRVIASKLRPGIRVFKPRK